MKSKFFFFVSFFLAQQAFSQEILFESFESDAAVPAGWNKNGAVYIDNQFPKTGANALMMTTKEANLTTKTLERVGRVDFWFLSPKYGDDYTVLVEYSKDNKSWNKLVEITQKHEESMGAQASYRIRTAKIPDLNVRYIRWSFVEYHGGMFYMDDIRIHALTDEEITQVKKRDEEILLAEQISKKVREENVKLQYKDARATLDNMAKRYNEKLVILQRIMDKTSGMIATTETGIFVFERSQMANPKSYKEFDTWFESLHNITDDVMKSYLTDLNKQFDRLQKREQTFKQLSNAAAQMANVYSGGKLESLTGNFKSVFATCYSKANLESLYPAFQSITKGKTVSIEKNEENIKKVEQLHGQGKSEYAKLRAFFEIIENENAIISTILEQWKESSRQTQDFENSVNNFVKNYMSLVDMPNAGNLVDGIRKNNAESMSACRNTINRYFNDFISSATFNGFTQSQMEQIQLLNRALLQVEDLIEQYYSMAGNFRALYQLFINDLARNNPFEEYNAANKTNYFQDAIKQWADAQRKAKGKVDETSKRIESLYVNYNVRSAQ